MILISLINIAMGRICILALRLICRFVSECTVGTLRSHIDGRLQVRDGQKLGSSKWPITFHRAPGPDFKFQVQVPDELKSNLNRDSGEMDLTGSGRAAALGSTRGPSRPRGAAGRGSRGAAHAEWLLL